MAAMVMPALAADDPLSVVNNLSEFIFSLIRAVGLILLGFGVLQLGLSLKPRPFPAGQRYADRRGRHCDYFYQRDPHPYHRPMGQKMAGAFDALPPFAPHKRAL